MKIKSISLANFKAFGPEAQSIPIKPITLIFGANSAGKSSLIHSLLWMHHALSEGEVDIRFPKAGKGNVDLGSFEQIIYEHESSRRILIQLVCDASKLPKSVINNFSIKKEISVDFSFGIRSSHEDTKPNLLDYRLSTDGKELLRAIRTSDGLKINTLEFPKSKQESTTELTDEQINQDIKELTQDDASITDFLENFRQESEKLSESEKKELINFVRTLLFEYMELSCKQWVPERIVINKNCKIEDIDKINIKYEIKNATDLIQSTNEILGSSFRRFCYIPPLRELPKRYFDLVESDAIWQKLFTDINLIVRTNDWLQGSGMRSKYVIQIEEFFSKSLINREIPKLCQQELRTFACQLYEAEKNPHLFQQFPGLAATIDSLKHKFFDQDVADYLYRCEGIVDDICKYDSVCATRCHELYGDILDLDEEDLKRMSAEERFDLVKPHLNWEAYINLDNLNSTSMDDASFWVTDLFLGWIEEQPEFQELFELWNDLSVTTSSFIRRLPASSVDVKREISLLDLRSKTRVSLQDVGVGFSQVLPVLLHAFGEKEKLIAIEQPEIHIHPALQAELADVFIESAIGENQNTFLLETHSEHLILRILRRIRETTRGKLPEGMHPIRPEDVSVLYVEPGEEGAVIKELRINDQGRFVDEWPNGFFEERFNEEF